jgi:hypothetical protein
VFEDVREILTGVVGALIVAAIHAIRRAIVSVTGSIREHEVGISKVADTLRRVEADLRHLENRFERTLHDD